MTEKNELTEAVNEGEDSMDFFTPNDATMDFFGDGFSFFGSSDEPATVEEKKDENQENIELKQETVEAVANEEVKVENVAEPEENTPTDEKPVDTAEKPSDTEKEVAPVEEEKPKRKTRKPRAKKTVAKASDNSIEENTENNITVSNTRNAEAPDSEDVFTIPVDPHLDIRNIVSSLNLIPDTTFVEVQKDIQEKMNAIKVERNIDKANIMLMYDLVDELSDILRARYAAVKTIYDNLVNRDIGIIANVKKLNSVGTGTVADKERNAIRSLINYQTDDMPEPVNLIQFAWAANYEYNFIESAIDQLETKRRLLRGMEDALV